jgi:hypothetical protein
LKNFFVQKEDNPFIDEKQHIDLITGEKIALDIQSVPSPFTRKKNIDKRPINCLDASIRGI